MLMCESQICSLFFHEFQFAKFKVRGNFIMFKIKLA